MTLAPADFEAIEARLWAILEPYRGRLEAGSVYGLVTLKWVGTKQHDFFAGVRVAHRGLLQTSAAWGSWQLRDLNGSDAAWARVSATRSMCLPLPIR
jgi:hypothetical protein